MSTQRRAARAGGPMGGFTLVELVVTMLIVAIAAGAVMAAFGGFALGRDLETAAVRLTAELRHAAAEAGATGGEVRVYFEPESAAYSVWRLDIDHEADTDADAAAAQALMARRVTMPRTITLESLAFAGGADGEQAAADDPAVLATDPGWPASDQYVAFTADGGATGVLITLADGRGGLRRIQVSDTARVEEASPAEEDETL